MGGQLRTCSGAITESLVFSHTIKAFVSSRVFHISVPRKQTHELHISCAYNTHTRAGFKRSLYTVCARRGRQSHTTSNRCARELSFVRFIYSTSIQPHAIELAIAFPEALFPCAVSNRVSRLLVFFILDRARFKLDSTSCELC